MGKGMGDGGKEIGGRGEEEEEEEEANGERRRKARKGKESEERKGKERRRGKRGDKQERKRGRNCTDGIRDSRARRRGRDSEVRECEDEIPKYETARLRECEETGERANGRSGRTNDGGPSSARVVRTIPFLNTQTPRGGAGTHTHPGGPENSQLEARGGTTTEESLDGSDALPAVDNLAVLLPAVAAPAPAPPPARPAPPAPTE